MVTVLQVLMVLLLIVLLVVLVFRPKRKPASQLPENYKEILLDYVKFYNLLSEDDKILFEQRLQKFLSGVTITGVNAAVDDLDRVLIGAGAVIPVFRIYDWEYVHLREVLVYPGNFNVDFDQHGSERNVTGMVGTGAMQNVMIISKWELRQGFINAASNHNTAIHEFVHLIDKMDGSIDGIPELLLERKFVPQWIQLINAEIDKIRNGSSDINAYAATNAIECFAVIAEYFFEQPELFAERHPELNMMMERIFIKPAAANPNAAVSVTI